MPTATTKLPARPATASSSTAPKRSQKGPVFWVVLGIIGLFLLFGGIKALQIFTMVSAGAKMVPPPTTVTSAIVQQADWQPTLGAVGSVSPVQGAMISAEVPGMVAEIAFDSGKPVKKGDLLLKLDASSETAQLRSAEADARLAKADYDRARELADRKVISRAELDAAQSNYTRKKAMVDNMQAVIDKKEIRAPFDGVAGIRSVNPGQMVAAGDPLVSLQTLDRVFVDFSLPQQELSKLSRDLPVTVKTDAIPGREFTGKLTAINSSIDPATRSVKLQTSLDNADHALRAGMFAKVSVLLPEKNSTLYVPATAVAYAPFGDSVYVIDKKHDDKTKTNSLVLRQQFIRTGETRGDFVSVKEGLQAGQEIASTGAFKLRNGMTVVVDNKLAPKAQLAPAPDDT